jgi:predicted enzyme related to lactoylglutathione lyase
MLGRVRVVFPAGSHEAAAVEDAKGPLHRALGEPGLQRDVAVAHPLPLSPPPRGAPPEKEVDRERRRGAIVPDKIPEQHVHDVIVQPEGGHGYIYYDYSNFEAPLQAGACYGTTQPGGKKTMIKRIKFTTVPVEDQGRALDFYTNKLGLKVFTDQTAGGERWIELKVPGADTMLVLFPQKGFQPSEIPAVVFVTDGVQKTYEDLKGKGVEFTQPPKKAPWGEHAILKDTEGNLVLIGT